MDAVWDLDAEPGDPSANPGLVLVRTRFCGRRPLSGCPWGGFWDRPRGERLRPQPLWWHLGPSWAPHLSRRVQVGFGVLRGRGVSPAPHVPALPLSSRGLGLGSLVGAPEPSPRLRPRSLLPGRVASPTPRRGRAGPAEPSRRRPFSGRCCETPRPDSRVRKRHGPPGNALAGQRPSPVSASAGAVCGRAGEARPARPLLSREGASKPGRGTLALGWELRGLRRAEVLRGPGARRCPDARACALGVGVQPRSRARCAAAVAHLQGYAEGRGSGDQRAPKGGGRDGLRSSRLGNGADSRISPPSDRDLDPRPDPSGT